MFAQKALRGEKETHTDRSLCEQAGLIWRNVKMYDTDGKEVRHTKHT